jgi:nicotinate-nucleotide adenylyltransferase
LPASAPHPKLKRLDSKIGFYGGSFDPVHLGHLIAAQDAHEQLGLDRLYFLPAAQAPLRADSVRAAAADRLELLRLATAGDSRFEVLDWEIARGGISYTIDTALRARHTFPGSRLIWIIGEDQLDKLSRWHRAPELVGLVEFACLQRPGHAAPVAPDIEGLRLHRLVSHQIALSSTEIRQRIRKKRSLRFLLPDSAINYIQETRLYIE